MRMLLIPAVLLLLGSAGGVGAALMIPKAPDHETPLIEEGLGPCGPVEEPADSTHAAQSEPADDGHGTASPNGRDYARLTNQFLIPVVEGSQVASMVVLTLSLEVMAGQQDSVLAHEPRLRAVMLQVLFDHANSGGFDGMFTATSNMRTLRNSLRAAAEQVVGSTVTDVLIIDIVRQDV